MVSTKLKGAEVIFEFSAFNHYVSYASVIWNSFLLDI